MVDFYLFAFAAMAAKCGGKRGVPYELKLRGDKKKKKKKGKPEPKPSAPPGASIEAADDAARPVPHPDHLRRTCIG